MTVNVCPADIFPVCPIMSTQYLLNHSTFFLGMVVYYHEVMCHAEKKIVYYLQCQDHSEGLYNQKITIFTVSSKLLVHL